MGDELNIVAGIADPGGGELAAAEVGDLGYSEDWLDAKLRDDAPYLDDAGFTARVVHQLPAPRRSSSLRAFILLGVTLLACVIAYVLTGGEALFANAAENLAAMPFKILWIIAGACGLLISVLGASAAIVGAREQRSFKELGRGF